MPSKKMTPRRKEKFELYLERKRREKAELEREKGQRLENRRNPTVEELNEKHPYLSEESEVIGEVEDSPPPQPEPRRASGKMFCAGCCSYKDDGEFRTVYSYGVKKRLCYWCIKHPPQPPRANVVDLPWDRPGWRQP